MMRCPDMGGERWCALLASLDGDDGLALRDVAGDASPSARAGHLMETVVLPRLYRGLAPQSATPLPFTLAQALASRPDDDNDKNDEDEQSDWPVRDQLAWRVLTLVQPLNGWMPLAEVHSLDQLDFSSAYDFLREWLADR